MKLLLTSAGLTNQTIIDAFRGMLDKPTEELNIVVIPTAQNAETADKGWVIEETIEGPYRLGWKNFEIVDLAAMASLDKALWWPKLEQADVLLVGGGNSFYLSYWVEQSGLADVVNEWLETKVYVGISAGSRLATSSLLADPHVDELWNEYYETQGPPGQAYPKNTRSIGRSSNVSDIPNSPAPNPRVCCQ